LSKLLVYQLKSLTGSNSEKLFLLLCGLSDPFNLGAILRSAYFLGADGVLTRLPV